MNAVLSIARVTFIQQMRNRLYLVVFFFAAMLLGVSLLFGALAAEQELRVILDFGLATTELFGVVAAVFGAVTLVLEEMESRTLYLILTRPLPRAAYIVGRFLGLVAAVVASLLIMSVLHLLLLKVKGWETDYRVLAGLPFIYLKVVVCTALALFFSLFSSSAVSSVVFTFFFWILGHFGPELKFLMEKSASPATALLVKGVLFLVPNFQLLNYRDVFHVTGAGFAHAGAAAGYAFFYTAACLALSVALFSKKEF